MLLWNVAMEEGRSQRELADAVGLPASRIVGLVNSLEAEGLVERRLIAGDRRARALHLTRPGRAALRRITAISSAHERELSLGLLPGERATLARLLARIATQQRMPPRGHPGF